MVSGSGRADLVVGRVGGAEVAAIPQLWPLFMLTLHLEAGAVARVPLEPGHEACVYVCVVEPGPFDMFEGCGAWVFQRQGRREVLTLKLALRGSGGAGPRGGWDRAVCSGCGRECSVCGHRRSGGRADGARAVGQAERGDGPLYLHLSPSQQYHSSGVLKVRNGRGQVAVFGGLPLAEPRHILWNLAHSDRSKLELAAQAWRRLDRTV